MSNRMYSYLRVLIVAAFAFVIINSFLLKPASRAVRNDVIQGVLLGFGLGFATLPIFARMYVTKVNGWTTVFGCGKPGNGFLFRAACAQIFPGPVNVAEEAMYWTTSIDGAGHALSGEQDYTMRFPAGQLPPNNAFWSLTMADGRQRFGRIRATGTAWATGRDSCLTPTAPSIFTFRKPLRQAMKPTGYPRLQAISYSGCASTSPARQS